MLGKTINKRIIFDENGNPKEASSLKSNLFSESDNDDKSNEEEFNICKSDKLIKKTLKLIELRSKLADDPRFKVTEDFIEDESDNEEISLKEKKNSRFLCIPRFDPSKSDSQKYIVNKNDKIVKEKSSIIEEPIELPTKVKQERFYEIDDSLKYSFKNAINQEENSFSLLKLLGKEDEISEDQQNEHKGEIKKEAMSKTKKENKKPKQTNTRSEMKRIRNFTIKNRHIGYEKFFMIEDDIRLKDNSFFRTDLIKHHRDDWEKRQKIMMLGFKKRKRKVKNEQQIKKELEKGRINSKNKLYITKLVMGDKFYPLKRILDKKNKNQGDTIEQKTENSVSLNLEKSL